MVVDTSAVIAILLGEPETGLFARALTDSAKKMMSAFNALESAIVIGARKGEAGGRELDLLLHRARIEIIALNNDQVEIALTAWRKIWKGKPSCRPEYWRLLRLCTGTVFRRTVTF